MHGVADQPPHGRNGKTPNGKTVTVTLLAPTTGTLLLLAAKTFMV